MKRLLSLIPVLLTSYFSVGQTDGPQEITPQLLQQLKAGIEKEIPAFKQTISEYASADEIEFTLDTFRIQALVSKRMDIDYSTAGMNRTINEMAASYDKLMNKYYNKLLKALKPVDQKTLIAAQKAWLAYRDAEGKLISTMTKEEYSGGGTIQSNIAVNAYADLVVQRTIAIFNYYNSIIKEE